MRKRLPLLLLASCALFGADREFDRVVKAVESRYGVKRTHIPMLGVANLFAKVARPAGTSGFKLAVFENVDSSPEYSDHADLDHFFDGLSDGGLRPLIRIHSGRTGQSTYVLTSEAGKSTRMLIATFARKEATVIEVTVNMETLQKTIAAPDDVVKIFGLGRGRDSW